ncbi:aspartate aminotransferase family protein, partial [bacterium]|nr:aspartate aminotransferase family protein [bacterium]
QPDTYPRLAALAVLLADGLRDGAERAGLSIFQTRVGSMLGLFFTSNEVVDFQSAKTSNTERYQKFFHGMLERGHYFAPSQFEAAFVSLAHDEAIIAETVSAAQEVFTTL